MIDVARQVRAAAAGRVPVVVNDRVDVALAAQADGVHLGQDDMAVVDARRVWLRAILGLTLKSVAQAHAAPLQQLDYVCVGGVYATVSKKNPDAPVGSMALRPSRARREGAIRTFLSAPLRGSTPRTWPASSMRAPTASR